MTLDQMETCNELRREVIAYIGEHYNPEEGNPEEAWDDALKHVMGPEPKLGLEQWGELSPDELDNAVRVELAAHELLMALSRLKDDDDPDVYSNERMAAVSFYQLVDGLEDRGLSPDDFALLDDVSRRQELYRVVANWLANVRGGAVDATGAFYELEEEENERATE